MYVYVRVYNKSILIIESSIYLITMSHLKMMNFTLGGCTLLLTLNQCKITELVCPQYSWFFICECNIKE